MPDVRQPRSMRAGLRACLLAAVALAALAPARAAQVVQLTRITITVSNLHRTERFLRDGLGFERVGETRIDDPAMAHLLGVPGARIQSLVMRLGSEEVELQQYSSPGKPYPAGSRSPDRWFQHLAIIVSDMDRAYAHLRRVAFRPISDGGPQTLPPANGTVRAFKFRDPDGHPLELLYFPEGQGRAVWHASTNQLFLGIDHSAIGIADSPRSLDFYTHLLGLKQAYAGINQGPAQERLDGTFNAVVQITGVRPDAEAGPGVEFLDYRTPPTGRPAPEDEAANDLAHVHLTFRVDDLDALARQLFDARVPFVSPGVVAVSGKDYAKGLMVRDPDGHELLLIQ